MNQDGQKWSKRPRQDQNGRSLFTECAICCMMLEQTLLWCRCRVVVWYYQNIIDQSMSAALHLLAIMEGVTNVRLGSTTLQFPSHHHHIPHWHVTFTHQHLTTHHVNMAHWRITLDKRNNYFSPFRGWIKHTVGVIRNEIETLVFVNYLGSEKNLCSSLSTAL